MSRRLPPNCTWITLPSGQRRVEMVLDLGENPATGRRRQTRRRFRTAEDASEEYHRIMTAVRDGSYEPRATITVEQACTDWLAGRRIRKGTRSNYANSLKPIRRTYGELPLRQLTKKRINELITKLQAGEVPRADGRRSRSWQPPTVNLMLRVLSMVLDDACKQGLVSSNVVELVDRVPESGTPRPTYTPAQVRSLLARARTDRLEHAWHLALSGLRRGEVCGLAWTDIDWQDQTLTVRESRVSVDGEVVLEEPKTEAGKRTLPLTPALVAALKRARRRQATERLKAGPAYQASGYVVVDQLGRAPHPETISDYWDRLVAGARVPRNRLHDARHTCGTLLHLQGVPTAVIAAWLGHANGAFTMQTYVHSQNPALQDAARTLGAVTSG